MTRLVRGVGAMLLGLLALSTTVPATAGADPAQVAAEPAQVAAASAPVVLLGVDGLSWPDVSPSATPNLWGLLDQSAVAAVSVRTVAVVGCPADAWLTLNTGVRTGAPRDGSGGCVAPSSLLSGKQVSRWSDIASLGAKSSYNPDFGLLATGAARRGCVSAVGPGAGLALADARGQVARYTPQLQDADLSACPLTVVDVAPGGLDAAIAKVRAAAPSAELVVVGLPNGSTPHLQALLVHGGATGWLDANSTRHPGLVQLTDLTPTVLSALGVAAPDRAVGSVLRTVAGAPRDPQKLVQQAGQFDRAAQTIDRNVTAFYWLVGAGALVAGGLLIAFRRPRWLILVTASLPVASFLANLLQWWRFSQASLVLWIGVIGWAVVVGTAARFGPWRRQQLGSAGFVAAVTAAVLAADVVTGSRLQLSSLWGLSPLDAGRFYGVGNVAFGALAMGALIGAAWIASVLIERGQRRWAVLSVAAVGAVAVAVDGWPAFGADFGGVLALVPGFAVLVIAVAGIRLRARWVLAVIVGAIVAVVGIALLDWSRPPGSRSHLGNFVQQVIDGGAGSTLRRKLDANVQSFTDRPLLAVLVVVIVLLTAVLVIRPERLRAAEVFAAEPRLRACIAACLVTAVVGVAANDSGVIVIGICCAVAVPLLVHGWRSVTPDSVTPDPRRTQR
ncbi:hypothetical protein [Kribbella sp.]|uniref:hypothetical protein n=1 Tax=Kribbella sp. TaxID=1871183 RepID=UPI002D48C630|nr:hypothetical protein [Kribbella sp.]HZX09116.1 hypothetical protein [Kribbella sp.]